MEPNTALLATVATDTSIGGLGSVLIILTMVVIPFIVKFWNWSKETSAQGVLYSQLSELVQKQRGELDSLYSHRTIMQEQLFELRHKVEAMDGYEQAVEVLKKKLDQKDLIIAERDSRITHLLEELLQMKDRVHSLELRLKADEAKFCEGCSLKMNEPKNTNLQYIPFVEGGKDE